MHATLCAQLKLCAHTGPVCSPDSIDTFISLIRPNMAEIWACACKNKVCMHASLRIMVKICAHTGPVYSPDSVDTLISLIQTNLAENSVYAR